MTKIFSLCLVLFLFGCKGDEEDDLPNTDPIVNYRQEMRDFVGSIANYARTTDADFIVIPQNGQELATTNGMADGLLAVDYISTINGQGREELYYGYDNEDDVPTPLNETNWWMGFLNRMHDENITILATDYCSTVSNVDDSYAQNENNGFISFAADQRDLWNIPAYPSSPHNENSENIETLDQAQNFLYLINPQNFAAKSDFITAINATNFDAIIMDCFFEDEEFTPAEIAQLKVKANGASRLVISYMSIGEAEDYRFYWQSEWSSTPPTWLGDENPDWVGNFIVHYWDPSWQAVITGNENSYIHKIVNTGFDGVYLDIIDAYEYWE